MEDYRWFNNNDKWSDTRDDRWNDSIVKLAMLMANNNETVAMHNLNKEKKVYKYHMALELAENNVIIAKQILDLSTTAKARKLGMSKTAYMQQKQQYKKEKEALLKKLQNQDKRFVEDRKRLLNKHKKLKPVMPHFGSGIKSCEKSCEKSHKKSHIKKKNKRQQELR